MKRELGVLFGLLLAGANAMACYTVYDGNGRVVYRGLQTPVDMSLPLHQALAGRFPAGSCLVFDQSPTCTPVSIAQVAQAIQAGQYSVGIAGGTETMTMVPMGGNKVSANPELMDKHPEVYTTMGATAEKVAAKFDVKREDQDVFAANSQKKATEAREKGIFKDEIAPITVTLFDDAGKARQVTVSDDTIIRAETTLEGLQKLKPAFDPKGTVTAGNASPLTDGAGAAVVMSEAKAKELGVKPLGYFVDFAVAGVPPEIMGIGPVPAIRKLLEKNKLKTSDIDVYEINEAFAAQAAYCSRELGLDASKVNPNGGAIALGHPLGTTGTRQTGTLLCELARRNGKLGVVSMCIGGGMGAAALFSRE